MRKLLILALVLLPAAARAGQDEVTFRLLAQSYKAINGSAETPVEFGAEISVWGPLALGESAPLLLGVRLGLGSQPGVPLDSLDLQLVRSANATLFAGREIGRMDKAGIATDVVIFWGFDTARTDQALVDRTLRRWGVGLRMTHKNGSELLVSWGRNEASGPWGWGQWQLEGRVALAKDQLLVLGADAILAAGPSEPGQRDGFRVWMGTDLAAGVRAITKKP